MLYYGMITLAVTMFSCQFFFKNMYRNACGSDLRASLTFSALSGLAGLTVLFFMNGMRFEFSVFALCMAALAAVNSLGFTFCSLKALGKINLSLYSMFSMLGGMVLPFAAGILFYRETLTAGKVVCFLFVTAALLCTVQKGTATSGVWYYIGVFVLNGMSGVLTKIYQAAPFDKISSTGYSMLQSVVSICLAGSVLLFLRTGERHRLSPGMLIGVLGNGPLGTLANLLLLISLSHLPASTQYPFVTGGVMIMSTILCFFTQKKPGKRDMIAVALAFIGILALVLFA